MRVFVTGASGWIGSAVVPELLGAGHEVVGLARSEASAEALAAVGAEVRRGDLDDPDGLAKAAPSPTASSTWPSSTTSPRRRLRRGCRRRPPGRGGDGAALAGSDRPLVLASGLLGMSAGRVATEDDGLVPNAELRANPASRRSATALLTLSLRGIGVRSSVLRLPPTVHGDGDHGFMATIVGIARQRGVRDTSARAPTAGRRYTDPTPPDWPDSPSRAPRQARSCMPSATRGPVPPYRRGDRPPLSSPRRRCPRPTPSPTSAGWDTSSVSTPRPPPRSPGSCSAGRPPDPPCSRISTKTTTSGRPDVPCRPRTNEATMRLGTPCSAAWSGRRRVLKPRPPESIGFRAHRRHSQRDLRHHPMTGARDDEPVSASLGRATVSTLRRTGWRGWPPPYAPPVRSV